MSYISNNAWLAMLAPTFVFSVILTTVFSFKKEKGNNTTKIFNVLLKSNLLGLLDVMIIILLVNNFGINNWIPRLLARIFLSLNSVFITFIGLYSMSILHIELKKNKNYYNKAYKRHIIMIIGACTIQMLLPVSVDNCNFNGPGVIFASVYFGFNVIFWTMLIIKYKKKMSAGLIIQAITLLVVGAACVALTFIFDNSHTVSIMDFLVVMVLYLKAENPDIKYITELNTNREETEKALSAKNDFLNSMSDELTDPLNKILQSATEMYTYKNQVNSEIQEDLDYILPTSKNLYEIVGNIIDINKIENNQIKIYEAPYNPIKTIEKIVEAEKERNSKPDINIEYEFDDSVPVELTGDEAHVSQIVRNLVNNAIKYTEKGTVKIMVVADQINYDTYNLKIKVSDTGIGIKNEALITLFTNFSKLTEQKNSNIVGTGLGLSITKKLIDLLHGTITVESIYKSGSTFTVSIPHKIS